MTLSYAAPEQLRGDEVTPRTDIYQLGIVLSELLAGFPPEPRLNAIILTALRQKRADYVSAAAFADDLERYVALRTLPLVARLARFITSVAREVRSALGTGSTT
jgi:serine/threonine protein kinase